ncbi:MAG: hypothetical protein FWD65_06265 [Coriobacteriia bacterium]|nr:hypothetical protein [Coriobacteriia bacterium]
MRSAEVQRRARKATREKAVRRKETQEQRKKIAERQEEEEHAKTQRGAKASGKDSKVKSTDVPMAVLHETQATDTEN